MTYLPNRLAAVFISAPLLAFIGCGSATPPPQNAQPHQGELGGHNHADHEHGASVGSPMEQMKASLAELSPADAAAAERQHFCPVSGEMLGTMGPPEKVEVEGREVWICCDSCRERLLADPALYFAKLINE